MSAGVVGFLIALAVAAILVFPLGRVLSRHPVPFYLGALVVTGLYAGAVLADVSLVRVRFLTVIFQKGYLASILLAVVMFTGCLDRKGALRRRLQPLRGSLSILSFIFILGHLLTYAPSFLMRLGAVAIKGNVLASLIVALALTVLFALLTLTSVRVVRHAMSPRAWKGLQRTSYLMVALLAVHVGLALGASALSGRALTATVSLVAYLGAAALYAVLRLRRWRLDCAAPVACERTASAA